MFALVDCNNFYVSCERVFDLSLLNKPVAILSNNDGCVISRSNAIKALGIKMGVPYFQLKPLIKQHGIVIRSSNYELYGDLSKRVMTVLGDFSPDVEPYSIDEAFLLLSLTEGSDYFAYGQQIRRKILKWVGIPVGVGIAPTRTLAKIANHIGKKSPEGVFVMPENPTNILAKLPVGEIWGIGQRLTDKLNRLGINTAKQLRSQDDAFIRKQFNVCVARTVMELNGTPALEMDNIEEPSQSISCSRSFGHPVIDLRDLTEAVAVYTSTAATKLRKENQKAAGANVYFQYYPEYGNQGMEGGITGTTVVFDFPTGDTSTMLNKIAAVLPGIFIEGRRYKKAGVVFYGLESSATVQPDIFSYAESSRRDKLYEAVDKINKQFGKKTIFHLAEGIQRPWTMKRDHLSPNYTTDWQQIPVVK
jgi:DNA polymerase V